MGVTWNLQKLGKVLVTLADDMEPLQAEHPERLGNQLAPDEYDFSKVTAPEYDDGEFYEYARECLRLRDNVRRLREAQREAEETGTRSLGLRPVFLRTGSTCEAVVGSALAKVAAFPDTPWLRLGPPAKAELKQLRVSLAEAHDKVLRENVPVICMESAHDKPEIGEMTLRAWFTKLDPPGFRRDPVRRARFLASGFFHVNLTYRPGEIMMEFAKWLRRNHPDAGSWDKREHRGRPTERLNALGAMRLRYHCGTLREAQAMVRHLNSKKGALSYSDRRAWNRACDQCMDRFKELFPDVTENPLHFTAGWRK